MLTVGMRVVARTRWEVASRGKPWCVGMSYSVVACGKPVANGMVEGNNSVVGIQNVVCASPQLVIQN